MEFGIELASHSCMETALKEYQHLNFLDTARQTVRHGTAIGSFSGGHLIDFGTRNALSLEDVYESNRQWSLRIVNAKPDNFLCDIWNSLSERLTCGLVFPTLLR